MKKALALCAFLAVLSPLAVFAQEQDLFSAGAWEFGGSLMYTAMPSNPVFSDAVTDDDKKDALHILELSARAGWFIMDNFSLVLSPSLMYMADLDFDPAGDDKRYNLFVDLGMEPTYYLNLGGQSVLSFALNFSIGFLPGLDRMNNGSDVSNDSFSMLYSLEPKAAYYFFLGERLAPFAELGYKFLYQRDIKESDGSDTVYPDGYSMFDDLHARLRFTVGFKYFLPSPARVIPAPQKGELDIMLDGRFDG